MFRQLWNQWFGAASDPEIVRLSPALESQSWLLQGDLAKLSTTDLLAICEGYWKRFPTTVADIESGTWQPPPDALNVSHERYLQAGGQLQLREAEVVIPWACRMLAHDNYDARELSATLLQHYSRHEAFADHRPSVEAALLECVKRVPTYDNKEAQANTVALMALTDLGGKKAFAAIRHVLTDEDWLEDDLSWEAAMQLGRLTGVDFSSDSEPAAAAQQWLAEHPHP